MEYLGRYYFYYIRRQFQEVKKELWLQLHLFLWHVVVRASCMKLKQHSYDTGKMSRKKKPTT